MGRATFCLGGLVVVLLVVVAVDASCSFGETPVDSLCSAALCLINKVCRVVKSSTGFTCSPTASCLKCIPKGADDVCNSNHYYYAVLTGVPGVIGQLTDLKCNINGPEDPRCPKGSVCLPDRNGTGTCCYGKGYPPPNVHYVRNNDTVCPDKCGGCSPGYECKATVNPCLIAPCPVSYRCVEKVRHCPVYPLYIPEHCTTTKEKSKCRSDKGCKGKLICCADICGVRRCTLGIY